MPSETTKETLIADLVLSWRMSDRINQYLIDQLTDEAWTAKPPGGKGRTVAALFAHMHNVRLMWLRAADKTAALPGKAEKGDLTRAVAKTLLEQSADAIARLLERTLASGRVSGFPPNASAFLAYILSHDAHHRGQATMLARLAGHPLPAQAGFGMWEWNKRWQER
jgi:uncharacterized damage-inducible protein DinB